MKLSLIFAQALVATVLAYPVTFKRDAQEIEAEAGDSISGGPAALSNPNINNGKQIDSSLIASGGPDAGDLVNNAFGNSFININTNSANKDNLVINPTTITSNGNSGMTANGNQNGLGNTQDIFPSVFKRDTFINGGTFDSHWAGAVPVYPGVVPLYPPIAYAPLAAQVNHNHQGATIQSINNHIMATIPTIEFGTPGNKTRVPRIGLGIMGMSQAYGEANDKDSVKVLNHAIDIGCTFWDTSDIYGLGHNERLISCVLKERRKDVFLCTKFGVTWDEPGPDFDGLIWERINGVNGSPEYVFECVENSLRRLGTDYIDLYYQHRMDPKVPIEETMSALAELVKQGKIRYIGLSECTPEELRRACKIHPVSAVQVEYSPWSTHIEKDGILDTCRELGVTIVAYSPLGRGIMSGNVRSVDDLGEKDWRRNNPRFKAEHFENNLKLVDAFAEIAKKYDYTSSQLALAWVLAQEENLIIIPGTTKIKYLEQNTSSGKIKLSAEDLASLRKIVDNANILGSRY
ncbi:hypothetical protein IWW42_005607 [Coemansia sp. RSA 1085]|nr:hypothetical protein IWW42_005607 [Coemansia sp. RSA 1085]